MTEPKFERYDVTDFLKADEDVVAYLNAALDDAHPEIIAHAMGNIARLRGMSRIAKACGLGRESLYKSLSERGNPEFGTVLKVLKAIGIRLRAEVDTRTTPKQNRPVRRYRRNSRDED